ncbi:MAG: glycoside hydrolase family 3 protein, partial [Maribacter arcticus]
MISTAEAIDRLSKTEKVGQLFMPSAFINDTEEEIQQIEKLISTYHIGGLCFFHSRASAATNFEGKKKVVKNENSFEVLKKLIIRYQKAATYPLLISIDAEWGLAMRIENTPQYPYAITLGANLKNIDLTFEVGKQIAKDCKAAGIHWNLSPVVDINTNPNNPVIGYRSFGDDKENVVSLATAYVKGTQSEGVLTSIKHFPGHGDTATDSHLGLPVIDKSKKELLENELFPFQKLIDEGVDSVMVGHLSVPALTNDKNIPSSINKDIITGILRNEMGFDGVVISDALNMHAVSKNYPIPGELEWLAFNAGNDVLCFAEHIEEGIQMILENATEAQINKSIKRIWNLKVKAIGRKDIPEKLTDPSSLN